MSPELSETGSFVTHAAASILRFVALAGVAFAGDVAAQSANDELRPGAATAVQTIQSLPDADELLKSGDPGRVAGAITQAADWDWLGGLCAQLADPQHFRLLSDSAVIKALAERLPLAPEAAQPQILAALGKTYDREALRAVMRLLESDRVGTLERLAIRCLIDQTGRADLGEDPQAWRQWWSENEWIPEGAWLARVAQWQLQRAHALRDRVISAEKRSYEVHRELYSLTPAEQRPALLVKFLDDQFSDVRGLGLDLTTRLVINATPAPPEAIARAVKLLHDRTPEVRASAAQLLAAVGLNGRAAEISGALLVESNPGAARAMLEALALGRPARRDMRIAANWLNDPEAGPAAARLLIAAAENAEFIDPSVRNEVWASLHGDMGRRLGPMGVRLFGMLAPAAEFERLVDLLQASDRTISEAAAEALALRPDGVDALLRGAATHQSLARFCAGAIRRWRNTAAGWAALRQIAGFPEEMLENVAHSMSLHEAIAAAETETSPRLALTLLERFDTASAPAAVQARLVEARQRALFASGDYQGVIKEARRDLKPEQFPSMVRIAMLCLEQCDDAVAAGATAEDWFEAIGRLAESDAARSRRLAALMQSTLGDGLSESDLARLQTFLRQPSSKPGATEALVPANHDHP